MIIERGTFTSFQDLERCIRSQYQIPQSIYKGWTNEFKRLQHEHAEIKKAEGTAIPPARTSINSLAKESHTQYDRTK